MRSSPMSGKLSSRKLVSQTKGSLWLPTDDPVETKKAFFAKRKICNRSQSAHETFTNVGGESLLPVFPQPPALFEMLLSEQYEAV